MGELEDKVAEAKKEMLGSQAAGGKIILLVSGDARIESSEPKVEVRKV